VQGLAKQPGMYQHSSDKEEGVRKGLGIHDNPAYR